jgi:hypothetical protein
MQQKKPTIAIANEIFGRELFKLFLQSLECIKTNIPLKLPLTIVALIMNVPPIMVVPLYKCVANIIT